MKEKKKMGAHNFEASVYAPTAADGYKMLVDEAVYDHGHDAYNGTISTTHGFKIVRLREGESSNDWFSRVLDLTEKWGDCACTEAAHVEKNDEGWSLWHFTGWAAS